MAAPKRPEQQMSRCQILFSVVPERIFNIILPILTVCLGNLGFLFPWVVNALYFSFGLLNLPVLKEIEDMQNNNFQGVLYFS